MRARRNNPSDGIRKPSESLSLSRSEREEIAHRLEAYNRDPTASSPWTEVVARVRARVRRGGPPTAKSGGMDDQTRQVRGEASRRPKSPEDS